MIGEANQCGWPRCRSGVAVGYLGVDLCWKHWTEVCAAQDRGLADENAVRRRLRLPPRQPAAASGGNHGNTDGALG